MCFSDEWNKKGRSSERACEEAARKHGLEGIVRTNFTNYSVFNIFGILFSHNLWLYQSVFLSTKSRNRKKSGSMWLSFLFVRVKTKTNELFLKFNFYLSFQGYVRLYNAFEQFYFRYVYRRIRDCFNRPICGVPGAEVTLKDRVTKDRCWTFE